MNRALLYALSFCGIYVNVHYYVIFCVITSIIVILWTYFFCVVTDAPTSTRPLPPFRGSLIMGYNTERRLYETSSVRRQLARDVQFFRRVGGWGSSRDLCRRPDMSVIRWSLGLSRVWIISRYVFLSVRGMTNWKVNEARSSYVIVYCTTEGPDYSSSFGSTEVGGREVSMTVIIIY